MKKPDDLISFLPLLMMLHGITFGAYGCDWVKTPAFDRVASEGIFFTGLTPQCQMCTIACMYSYRPEQLAVEEAANHSPLFPSKYKTYAEALGEKGTGLAARQKDGHPAIRVKSTAENGSLQGRNSIPYHHTSRPEHISNNDYARNFEAFLDARPEGQPFCFWYGSLEPHRDYEFEAGIKMGKKT
jgi:N-sulfoglucosamine sulfohydrolase